MKHLFAGIVLFLTASAQAELFPTLQSEEVVVEKNRQQLDHDISLEWEYPFSKKENKQEDGSIQREFSSNIGSHTLIMIALIDNKNNSDPKEIVSECVYSAVNRNIIDPDSISLEYGTFQNIMSASTNYSFQLEGVPFTGTIQCGLPQNKLLVTLVMTDQNSSKLHDKLLNGLIIK